MRTRAGAIISVTACLLLLVVLGWPYFVKSTYHVNTYYSGGVLNPLLAGLFVLGVLIVFAADRANYVSVQLGAGIVLGLSLITFLTVLMWAITVRLDVFRAPGWALPAQRFVLVGLSVLIVFGAGWHTWGTGLISLRR